MAETRLVKTTALAGLRPLGRLGHPAIDAHRQLAAVLRGRLGPGHAALFARPERRADGGIDWFTDLPGEIRPLEELDAAERSTVEAELSRMLTDVAALADAMEASGSDGARHLASLLRDAAGVAGPHARFAAGGRPVLILWGFAPEQELPGPPTPAVAFAPAAAPAATITSLAAAPVGPCDWWRWLLLALLLLIALLLLMRACAPLPPRSAAAGADPDALGVAEARGAELERELAALRRRREEAAACPAPPEIGAGEQPSMVTEGNAPVTPEPDPPPATEPAPAPARPEPPDLPDLPQIAEAPSPAPAPAPEPAQPEESCVPPRHPSEAPEVALVVDSSGSMEEPIAGAANRLAAAKDALVGCGVGGAAGAVYGGVDGYVTAKRTEAAENELAAVRGMTADVRAENEKMARLVESSQRVAENDRRRIEELKARIDANQISLDQARSEAKVVRENTAEIEKVLVEARARRDNYLEARAKLSASDTGELDREISMLSGEIAELETQLTLVNSSLQVSGLS